MIIGGVVRGKRHHIADALVWTLCVKMRGVLFQRALVHEESIAPQNMPRPYEVLMQGVSWSWESFSDYMNAVVNQGEPVHDGQKVVRILRLNTEA